MYLNRRADDYLGTEPARATFAMALFLPLLATLAVAARIWARSIKHHKLVADDWLSVLALLFHYCQVAGLGTFTQYPYGLSLGLARCSICMLLIRIFFVRRFKIAGTPNCVRSLSRWSAENSMWG
ncbi:MAG: hypothetical protein Q9173_002039 [Seirophora scorigena]